MADFICLKLLESTYILYNITEHKVSYVSTGGGTSLELLEGTYILYNIAQKIKSAMLVLEV
jgi:hypothetical protein